LLYNKENKEKKDVDVMFSFRQNKRLGISLPELEMDWHQYSKETQQKILLEWEKIKGKIPDRIKELESEINEKQEQLNNEFDFERSCQLNSDIAELASIINDLWLWYRMNQQVTQNRMHA
jgi:gas vesicle protein